MKKLFLTFLMIVIWGCSNQKKDQIPEQIQNLENLTVYSEDEKPAIKISFKKEVVYGDSDGILVGKMGEIAVDQLGRVFIEDAGKMVLYAFGPDGRFIAELGRDGRGPGEFSSINSIQTQKDRLYVFDAIQNRVNIFNLNALITEETIALAKNRGSHEELREYYPSIDKFYVLNNNSFIVKYVSNRSTNASHWQNVEMIGLLYLMDSYGNLSGKLIEFTDAVRTIFPVNEAAFDIPLTPFFGKSLTVISDEGSIYWAGPDHFLIKVYSPEGTYKRAFYYPHEKISITRKSAIDDGAPDLIISNPDLFINNINSIDLPETWPVLTEMIIDDQDRLWIATTVEDFDVYEWWILEETGELITTFEWPRDEPIEVVKNGKMYTRQTDEETGLQQVVRYRIEMEEG